MSQYRDFEQADDPQAQDWDGVLLGVNERLSPENLPPGMAAGAKNVRMRSGAPTTRLGVAKPAWMNVTTPGSVRVSPSEQPYGVGVYADPDGAGETLVIAAGGRVFLHRENQPRQELKLPEGVRILSRCVPVQAFNLLYLFRGKYLQPLVMEDTEEGFKDVVGRWDAGTQYNAFIQVTQQAADEIAYGPWQRITLTSNGTTATAVTDAPHGYVTGADITIRGADQGAYNGRFNVTVVDELTFTYALAQTAASPATGTIQASNMALYWQALGTQWPIASGGSYTLTPTGAKGITYLTALAVAGGVDATATCAGHGYKVGNWVTVSGAGNSAYDGTWRVTAVNGANSFSFRIASAVPPGPDVGDVLQADIVSVTVAVNSGVHTATVTTATAHGFLANQLVTIAGVGPNYPAKMNGTFTLATAGGTTFTYEVDASVPGGTTESSGGTAQSTGKISVNGAEGITSVGTTATVTKYGHGYAVGQVVTVAGATVANYNGDQTILAATPNTFSYTMPGTAASPAKGTITLGTTATMVAAMPGAVVEVTVTKTGHGFLPGQYVTVARAEQADYNGVWLITWASANTFKFQLGMTVAPDVLTASGLITLTGSVVLPGQTPDTNPEAWQQIYTILPNAVLGRYINNRLLVPTAYTPGAEGYDSSARYTKADYVAVTDVLDTKHFYLPNSFRINEGSADEIVDIVKYTPDSAVVIKGKSWGVLGGLTGDITASATLDMRSDQYGGTGYGAAVAAGVNLLFASPKRGLYGIQQNQLGQTRSVDTPFSNDLERTIGRVNWAAGSCIRMAWWDDKLYAAVPLDGATQNTGILVYDFRRQPQGSMFSFDFQAGTWDGVDEGSALRVLEFFEIVHAGQRRLCFLGSDGWCNVVEECWDGDQVADPSRPNGIGCEPIATEVLSRGYVFGSPEQKKFKQGLVVLGVWNAEFAVSALNGAAGSERAMLAPTTMRRTKYLKPVGKPDWDPGNASGDWGEPGRGDYSVVLADAGTAPGFELGRWQELTLKRSLRDLAGRYVQMRVTGSRGRMRLTGLGPLKGDGNRRSGILIG